MIEGYPIFFFTLIIFGFIEKLQLRAFQMLRIYQVVSYLVYDFWRKT